MPHPGNPVVVIGGTKGLGFDIARASAAAGARVTITGRDEAAAKGRAPASSRPRRLRGLRPHRPTRRWCCSAGCRCGDRCPGSTTISMANAAILGLANTLTPEIAPVRVNAITPRVVTGTAAVDDADGVRADWFEAMRRRTPAKRLPTVDDIVASVFLLLDTPGINGANLVVDAAMHLA